MIMANSSYTSATHEQNAQITELENRVKAIDPTALVTGEGALNRDLVLIADHDIQMVNIVSILAVFLIIAISFKSVSVPIVLVAAIEMAITINMGIPYFQGETIPFIASIVIGTIPAGRDDRLRDSDDDALSGGTPAGQGSESGRTDGGLCVQFIDPDQRLKLLRGHRGRVAGFQNRFDPLAVRHVGAGRADQHGGHSISSAGLVNGLWRRYRKNIISISE